MCDFFPGSQEAGDSSDFSAKIKYRAQQTFPSVIYLHGEHVCD